MRWRPSFASWLAAILSLAPIAARAADPAGAEREYRMARRLAAEAAAGAAEALERVVALDPTGVLADDALVEIALLGEPPGWPEALGRMSAPEVAAARAALDRAIEAVPRGDRTAEARYRRGLLRLEPLPGFDAAAARRDLLAASSEDDDGWPGRARYALAWLAAGEGDIERARAAWQRLAVEASRTDAGARARVSLARWELRDGEAGRAARSCEEVVRGGGEAERLAEPLRELAVRRLLGAPAAALPGRPAVASGPASRGVEDLAATAGGGALLVDPRQARILELSAEGAVLTAWNLTEAQAVAVDPLGRIWAAAAGAVVRLLPGGGIGRVAELGDWPAVSAVAADALGTVWVLERRGQRIGRLRPGAVAIEPFWEDRRTRFDALVWDGARLVGLDGRAAALWSFDAAGAASLLGAPLARRADDLAADPAGGLALLDAREGVVQFLAPSGAPLGDYRPDADGLVRPRALALGPDGALQLHDAASESWVRRP